MRQHKSLRLRRAPSRGQPVVVPDEARPTEQGVAPRRVYGAHEHPRLLACAAIAVEVAELYDFGGLEVGATMRCAHRTTEAGSCKQRSSGKADLLSFLRMLVCGSTCCTLAFKCSFLTIQQAEGLVQGAAQELCSVSN